MMIEPVGKPSPISFGMKHTSQEMSKVVSGGQVLGRKTMDIIELDNGKTVVVGTRYEGQQVKDKVLTLWEEGNHLVKTVIESWYGKKPSKLVLDEKQLDKLI